MTPKAATELAVVEDMPLSTLQFDSKQSRAAIKRCCAAWQHAYDAYLEGKENSILSRDFAATSAGPAFCRAMPPLAGYENICDFIACAAHGILIEAIPEKRANQLLYAAQVALSSLKRKPKTSKKRNSSTHPPLREGLFPKRKSRITSMVSVS